MSFELMARVLGGIGLFLLGMRLMTEGLQIAAGRALRTILARWTRTRLRGVGTGFLVTSLVQSSSAVTVATIGFVNAGLLTLAQALAVTYGSNIGTTMTGWLVAAIGFHVKVGTFALPLIGIGMALRLADRGGRVGPLGEALAGFGIFFLGIDSLRVGFLGLSEEIELARLAGEGAWRALLFVAIGFGLTVLMQSSSAAIAIVLTAAGGGVVPLGSGAALVIGANLGTTSTAALAVIGATPSAKRVAAAHVAFNVITAAVALLLLPLVLWGIVWGRGLLQLDAQPAAVLAGFHTVFNLMGVAILWPMTDALIRFLEKHFRDLEEDEAAPRYLDRNVLASPDLGLDAMVLELMRLGQRVRTLSAQALGGSKETRDAVRAGQRSVAALVEAIGDYGQMLQRSRMPTGLEGLVPTALRVCRHYSEAAELAGLLVAPPRGRPRLSAPTFEAELEGFVSSTEALLARTGVDIEGYTVEGVARGLAELQAAYQRLKSSLLDAGSRGEVSVPELVATLDWLSNLRRMAEQLERGGRFLASLRDRGSADPRSA